MQWCRCRGGAEMQRSCRGEELKRCRRGHEEVVVHSSVKKEVLQRCRCRCRGGAEVQRCRGAAAVHQVQRWWRFRVLEVQRCRCM